MALMVLSVSFLVKKWPLSFSRDVNCFHSNLAIVIDRVSHNLSGVKISICNLYCHSGVLLQYYMLINLILDSFLRLSVSIMSESCLRLTSVVILTVTNEFKVKVVRSTTPAHDFGPGKPVRPAMYSGPFDDVHVWRTA